MNSTTQNPLTTLTSLNETTTDFTNSVITTTTDDYTKSTTDFVEESTEHKIYDTTSWSLETENVTKRFRDDENNKTTTLGVTESTTTNKVIDDETATTHSFINTKRPSTRGDTSLEVDYPTETTTTSSDTNIFTTTESLVILTTTVSDDTSSTTDLTPITNLTKCGSMKDCQSNEFCIDGRCLSVCRSNTTTSNTNCIKGIKSSLTKKPI